MSSTRICRLNTSRSCSTSATWPLSRGGIPRHHRRTESAPDPGADAREILAEQIAFLGGEPSTTVPEVESATGREALAADLRLEESQLERYRQRFGQAMDLGLADVAEALRPLLEQTQEHVRDLQTALGR